MDSAAADNNAAWLHAALRYKLPVDDKARGRLPTGRLLSAGFAARADGPLRGRRHSGCCVFSVEGEAGWEGRTSKIHERFWDSGLSSFLSSRGLLGFSGFSSSSSRS